MIDLGLGIATSSLEEVGPVSTSQSSAKHVRRFLIVVPIGVAEPLQGGRPGDGCQQEQDFVTALLASIVCFKGGGDRTHHLVVEVEKEPVDTTIAPRWTTPRAS